MTLFSEIVLHFIIYFIIFKQFILINLTTELKKNGENITKSCEDSFKLENLTQRNKKNYKD